jgi:predicted  nucleic acid-binding Zn-ribbon protein
LNNIKEELRARDSDKTSSDRTADKVIEHLALLKRDIYETSSLREQLGAWKIKHKALEERCMAKDSEISSMRDGHKKLCEQRDSIVEDRRKRDALKDAANEDLLSDLARTRSDLVRAHRDSENKHRELASEQEKLLQAADSLRVAKDGLARLEKENAALSEVVRSHSSVDSLI